MNKIEWWTLRILLLNFWPAPLSDYGLALKKTLHEKGKQKAIRRSAMIKKSSPLKIVHCTNVFSQF